MRTFNFILLIFLLFTLNACNNNSSELKIGCITILSGEVSTYGKESKQGLDMAIEEVNNSGVLGEKKIEVIYEDSKMDARVGTEAITKLINIDKVPLIVGAFSSSVMMAIAPIAEKNKVVLISASATADAIKDAGDYIFRIVPPNKVQGRTAAKFAINKLKLYNAVIYSVNNEYGISLANEFEKAFTSLQGKVLYRDSFNPGQKDFRAALQKIKELNPQVIFFPGQVIETGLILKQAREIGIKSVFIGGDGSYSPDLIKIAGDASENSYYTLTALGYGISDSLIVSFETKFKSKYGADPTVFSSYYYELGKIIGLVLSKAEYNSTSIKNELYKIKDYKGITGYTSFDKFGEVNKDYTIYVVKNGAFQINNN